MAQMASLTLVMDLVTFCSSYCSSCCFIPAVSKWASWFLLRSDHSPLPESGARGLCVQMSWHLSSVSCVHRSRVIGPYTWPGWGCIFFFTLLFGLLIQHWLASHFLLSLQLSWASQQPQAPRILIPLSWKQVSSIDLHKEQVLFPSTSTHWPPQHPVADCAQSIRIDAHLSLLGRYERKS